MNGDMRIKARNIRTKPMMKSGAKMTVRNSFIFPPIIG
jgi:hypothetical protein